MAKNNQPKKEAPVPSSSVSPAAAVLIGEVRAEAAKQKGADKELLAILDAQILRVDAPNSAVESALAAINTLAEARGTKVTP